MCIYGPDHLMLLYNQHYRLIVIIDILASQANLFYLELGIDRLNGSGRFSQTILTKVGFIWFWQRISELLTVQQQIYWHLSNNFSSSNCNYRSAHNN